MRRATLLIGLVGLAMLSGASTAVEPAFRTFEFRYRASLGPFEAGAGPVHVFVPLALDNEHQRILSRSIRAPIPGDVEREQRYGNPFWHARLENPDGRPFEIEVTYVVERHAHHREPPLSSRALSDPERRAHAQFLAGNDRVLVDHPVLAPIRAEIHESVASDDLAALSRAIYDWVVDNVEYKKVGTGWGNGDTFWACIERYGNCTDFHALFISLARSEGIPARFEMGFPVPLDRHEGEISGYHCWVEFYLPEIGWLPIDASEAFKHPDKRDLFYGSHPPDRIHFTTGRDLRLGASHQGPPLNYLIYPYVEVGGKPWKGPVEQSFLYSDR
jgi:hypothetical protein